MSELRRIEAALGGEAEARTAWSALSPATCRAITRIGEIPGDDEPPPAVCVAIALAEGARPEVVLAVCHGWRPDAGAEVDPELAAVIAIDDALDAPM